MVQLARVAIVSLLLVSLPSNAQAFWGTSVKQWRHADLTFKIAYLSGFMQGHLLMTHVGDKKSTREHFKTCLSFASFAVFDAAMEKTMKRESELEKGEVGPVIMRTLISMCGSTEGK